jgi:uncharacterized protein YjaG (DUF416 family)
MSRKDFNSLDGYERFVSSTIGSWSREQRIALAAGMAERWLPVYESFSEEEEWGDPATFQRAVQSVWNCVLGHTLTPKEHRILKVRVEENTPHLDDFDAEEIIATSAMIDYALNCCVGVDNTGDTVMAMISGFEGVAPGIYTDAEQLPPDVWESSEVQDQLKKELTQLMENAPPADEVDIEVLRQELMSLPVMTDEGLGHLPSDVLQSPELQDQLEKHVKMRNMIGDIARIAQQQIEAVRQKVGPLGRDAEAEQASSDLWQSPQVQSELEKQLKLLKLIGDMARIDEQQIVALRQKLVSPELVGTVAPRPEPSRGLTNEAIFEQYRRLVEVDLKGKWQWETDSLGLGDNAGAMALMYIGEWLGRYSRRKQAIEEGPMIDVVAHYALLARSAGHDAAVEGDPGWDQEIRPYIEMCYQNPYSELEVNSSEAPHSYGPSLRRLLIEGRRTGDSDKDLWNSILQWGRHRPAAWEEEDRRKKQRLAYASPELAERLTRTLSWRATNDVDYPWSTEVAGETWRVRLNDFPDDIMYTLIINDAVIGDFHDWPGCWRR